MKWLLLFCVSAFSSEMAVVQLSFDGVSTHLNGVGTVVLQTKDVLRDLPVKQYLITADYADFSAQLLEKNRQECLATGGDVHVLPVENNHYKFGDIHQWQSLSKQGAELCKEIIEANEFTIVIAHDVAYAHVPHLLREMEVAGQYKVIWVPHSNGWDYVGHTVDLKPLRPERHKWEMEAMQNASRDGYKVGFIGENIKRQLIAFPFEMAEEDLSPYRTGILLDEFRKELDEEAIAQELKKWDIPLDKRIIFFIGRAVTIKGPDIVLEMFRHVQERYPDTHLVMLAPNDYQPDFLAMLKARNRSIGATIIDHFDTHLANYLYQWRNTAIVALLSRTDTQPLTIMEARANPKQAIVLASNQGGMKTQVRHGIDGFTCKIDALKEPVTTSLPLEKIEDVVAQAYAILELSPDERAAIVQEGKRLIEEKYDMRKAVLFNIETIKGL